MSTPAKILVGVLFLLSIIFLVVSTTTYSQKVDWKAKYGKLMDNAQKAVDHVKDQKSDLITERDSLNGQLTSETAARVSAEKERDDLRTSKEEINTLLSDANQMVSTLTATTASLNKDLSAKDDQIRTLQNEVKTANDVKTSVEKTLDEVRSELIQVAKNYRDAEGKNSELETAVAALQNKVDDNQNKMDTLLEMGIDINELVGATPAPKINALVMATEPAFNLVMLSVGAQDEVKIGYKFFIYRGNRYIGHMIVEKVYEDSCAGTVMAEGHSGIKVQVGDDATTHLSS